MLAIHLLGHVLERECTTTLVVAITVFRTKSALHLEHKTAGAGATNVSHCGTREMDSRGALRVLSPTTIVRVLPTTRFLSPQIKVVKGTLDVSEADTLFAARKMLLYDHYTMIIR
jgi:hypothetical protein